MFRKTNSRFTQSFLQTKQWTHPLIKDNTIHTTSLRGRCLSLKPKIPRQYSRLICCVHSLWLLCMLDYGIINNDLVPHTHERPGPAQSVNTLSSHYRKIVTNSQTKPVKNDQFVFRRFMIFKKSYFWLSDNESLNNKIKNTSELVWQKS